MVAGDIIIPEHYFVFLGSKRKSNKYHSVFRRHAGQPVYTKSSVILSSLEKKTKIVRPNKLPYLCYDKGGTTLMNTSC